MAAYRPTHIGPMRTRVTLEKPTLTTDAGAAQSKTYTSQGDVWARWTNAHGQEAVQEGAVQGPRRATLVIRYRSDVDAAWAVSKGGLRYQIIAPPDNMQERGQWLELQVELMTGSS